MSLWISQVRNRSFLITLTNSSNHHNQFHSIPFFIVFKTTLIFMTWFLKNCYKKDHFPDHIQSNFQSKYIITFTIRKLLEYRQIYQRHHIHLLPTESQWKHNSYIWCRLHCEWDIQNVVYKCLFLLWYTFKKDLVACTIVSVIRIVGPFSFTF